MKTKTGEPYIFVKEPMPGKVVGRKPFYPILVKEFEDSEETEVRVSVPGKKPDTVMHGLIQCLRTTKNQRVKVHQRLLKSGERGIWLTKEQS